MNASSKTGSLTAPTFHQRQAPLTAVALVLFTAVSHACQICIPYPKNSAADHLIDSTVAVLAKEDPEQPFRYQIVEVLKGNPGDESIELFIDSVTRRKLKLGPDRAVLIVRNEEGENPEWKRIAFSDETSEPLIRKIIELSPDWKDQPSDRVSFFANYLGDEDPQISTLAHLEVGRAPYAAIRKHSHVLSREELLAFLESVRYTEWHPLYILMLAQSENPEDHQRIRDQAAAAAKYTLPLNLAAWATAWIEIDTEAALAFYRDSYLSQPSRSREEVEAVLKALSVQGNNSGEERRESIIRAYATALQTHPYLAPAIVSDMNKWERADLAGPVSKLAAQRPPLFDLTTLMKLRSYARKASP